MINSKRCWYKNHYFRSILEAKWAFFFDCLDLDWCYEPSYFRLMDGRGYLPDFYLPKISSYVEIKGEINQNSINKMILGAKSVYQNYFILSELPFPNKGNIYIRGYYGSENYPSDINDAWVPLNFFNLETKSEIYYNHNYFINFDQVLKNLEIDGIEESIILNKRCIHNSEIRCIPQNKIYAYNKKEILNLRIQEALKNSLSLKLKYGT